MPAVLASSRERLLLSPHRRSPRKVAIVGQATTLGSAPFDDPSWEIWAHASGRGLYRRVDRWFDIHPREWLDKKQDYRPWARSLLVPIVMQDAYPDIPFAVKYPLDRVLAEFRPYFASQASWMIAMALTEGVDTLGLFGCHFEAQSEYGKQRPNFEYWLGFAEARGVKLVIPPSAPILKQPAKLYGFETHRGGTADPDVPRMEKRPTTMPDLVVGQDKMLADWFDLSKETRHLELN